MARLYSVIFIILFCPMAANAASFDCSKARTTIEVLICADSELSQLDEKLAVIYNKGQSTKSAEDKKSALDAQRAFLKKRLNVCPVPFKDSLSDDETGRIIECLRGQYALQISKLEKEIGSVQVEEAPPVVVTSEPVVNAEEPLISIPQEKIGNGKPDCSDLVTAKPYFIAMCVYQGHVIAGKSSNKPKEAVSEEKKSLVCSDSSLDKLERLSLVSAHEIINSDAISSLMNFGSAINVECKKQADKYFN